MNRRGFLGSILAAGVAPAIIRLPGVLMPVKAEKAIMGVTLATLQNDGKYLYRWIPADQIERFRGAGWETQFQVGLGGGGSAFIRI